MSPIDYNNDNTEEVIQNSSTYPMYYCPLCNYSMPMRDEYYDPDEYDDLDEYDDPGYRQRHRRRRRRRHPRFRPPFFHPWFFFSPFRGYSDYTD